MTPGHKRNTHSAKIRSLFPSFHAIIGANQFSPCGPPLRLDPLDPPANSFAKSWWHSDLTQTRRTSRGVVNSHGVNWATILWDAWTFPLVSLHYSEYHKQWESVGSHASAVVHLNRCNNIVLYMYSVRGVHSKRRIGGGIVPERFVELLLKGIVHKLKVRLGWWR